ncbi:dihydrolipoyl dehydrogenase [Methylocystis parvus]|uniref:Dihydrolipoyl dehydrogenase n=1 Tax=Methylocystis parvus TaxID=134 RepID=A0A6B8M344_9HYPH|nr:dihydrolipoyl dehydrogenase [Methylocystis parvus]QGM96209.1 dihydrolipoyl dehydrogenase [Methylocystis parvus]WBJ99963.1 dihydrolipoyl dehydrogenase [Methylocystis parvus OBBP]
MSAYDVLIIGGGPGGYVAAIRAAQLGLKTAVVEREHLGGICLNWGCIPTKALLRSADVYRLAKDGARYGVTTGEPGFDAARIVARSREAAGRLNAGVGFLLKKNKIDVIWGEATLPAKGEVKVGAPTKPPVAPQLPAPKNTLGEGVYQAKHIIVATGARPRALPGLEPDGRLVWTYFEALKPERFPKSLLVVGAGAIGVEFASFFRTFGVEVTLVEALPQILAAEDAEIAAFARKSFEKQGIVIKTATTVSSLEKKADSVVVTLKAADGAGEALEVERVLSAAGVVANIEKLGLETLGVVIEKGVIKTDGVGRTNIEGVYAIGDVAGGPMLAHKAEHEGVVCVEAIAGLNPHPLDKSLMPGCTYCHPQVASVGLTEEKAKAAGYDIRIGRFPYLGNGKAIALGEPEGLVKTIFDRKTGRLLGAHLVGAEATELIQGFVIAMNLETTEEELIHTVFPHPTLSETMHESVLDAFGRVIHV